MNRSERERPGAPGRGYAVPASATRSPSGSDHGPVRCWRDSRCTRSKPNSVRDSTSIARTRRSSSSRMPANSSRSAGSASRKTGRLVAQDSSCRAISGRSTYRTWSRPVCSRLGIVMRQPRWRSEYRRYSTTPRSARNAWSLAENWAKGLAAKSAMARPRASVTRWATTSWVRPWVSCVMARYRPPRSCVTWTKSLKWPACSDASWRLSTKVRSLRAS